MFQSQSVQFLQVFLIILIFTCGRVYLDILSSEDPSLTENVNNFIRERGYSVENHDVLTEDGYVLTHFRIFKPNFNGIMKMRPIFVFHGFLCTSEVFLINAQKNGSLAFFLADYGYDVWVGNTRGNNHGLKHLYLDPRKRDFWNFSLDEIARYDIPNSIDHILNVTKREKISFAGHSQGGITFIMFCTIKPEYQKKIELASLIAGSAQAKHFTNPIVLYVVKTYENQKSFRKLLQEWFTFPPIYLDLNRICEGYIRKLCLMLGNYIYSNDGRIEDSVIDLFLKYIPRVSVNQVLHFEQFITSKRFRRFDYGAKKNLEIYGKSVPPDYPIRKFNVPIAMYFSRGDDVVTIEDIEETCDIIKSCVRKFKVPDENWTHVDLILHPNVSSVLFQEIANFERNYKGN